MTLFKIEKRLEYIKEKPFRLEKEIQVRDDENLEYILSLVKQSIKMNKNN